MLLIHCADIHLGFRAYSRTTPDGMNQRTQDINKAFERLIEHAYKKADAVMLCGDLFDRLQPNNRTIAFCMKQMLILQNAHIPVYIVGGNHDTPKSTGISSPLELLTFFDNVKVVIDEYQYFDQYDNQPGNKLRFHLIPYCMTKKKLHEQIGKALKNVDRKEERIHFVLLHGAYAKCKMSDDVPIDSEIKALQNFDYIAMGHFHGQTNWHKMKDAFTGKEDYARITLESFESPVMYPGSLERLTFNEKNEAKGWFDLDVSGYDKDACIIPRPVSSEPREMLDLPDIDMQKFDDPTEAIEKNITEIDITDKICRMKIMNLSAITYRAIDFRKLKKLTDKALHFEFVFDIKEETVECKIQREAFKDMAQEWLEYCNTNNIELSLQEIGKNYIQQCCDGT